VQVLATAQTHTLSDDDLLPYLAYLPSDNQVSQLRVSLAQWFRNQPAEYIEQESQALFEFNPLALPNPEGHADPALRYREAVVPYSLAIQYASYVAGFWTPTDEWQYKFIAPASSSTFPGNDHVPSLHDVISSQLTHDPGRMITQTRYQGLWWGAERIWTEELVRLKLDRSQFVPHGTSVIYPPAGPSKSTREWDAQNGTQLDDGLMDSSQKALFMKINGLFVVEVDDADGSGHKVKECRASGMIYELVDEDWVESEDPNFQHSPISPHGKGKERAVDQSVSAFVPPSQASEASSVFLPSSSSNGALTQSISAAKSSSTATKPRPILTAEYPLPDPPTGYKFHPVLHPGHELVLSLSLISGRYYPYLLQHPKLRKALEHAVNPEGDGLYAYKHLWALEGLLSGIHQSMDPEFWKPTRFEMFFEGNRAARKQFRQTRELFTKQEQVMQDAVDIAPQPGPSQAAPGGGSSISAHM
jgi:hypothetical protein